MGNQLLGKVRKKMRRCEDWFDTQTGLGQLEAPHSPHGAWKVCSPVFPTLEAAQAHSVEIEMW